MEVETMTMTMTKAASAQRTISDAATRIARLANFVGEGAEWCVDQGEPDTEQEVDEAMRDCEAMCAEASLILILLERAQS